jgi:hypothetical protein
MIGPSQLTRRTANGLGLSARRDVPDSVLFPSFMFLFQPGTAGECAVKNGQGQGAITA